MQELFRIATWALILTNFLIFVVVPSFVKAIGFDEIIFSRGELTLEVIVFNFGLVISPLIFSKILKWKSFSGIKPIRYIPNQIELFTLVCIWVLIYVLSGGLDYRETDVRLGYSSRSFFLEIAFATINITMAITSALVLEASVKSKKNQLGFIAILVFTFCLILSGSRGLVIQQFLIVWISFHLQSIALQRYVQNKKSSNFELPQAISFPIKRLRLISMKSSFIGLLLFMVFAIWGLLRDGESEIIFATIYRLAEPYWHHALIYQQDNGLDLTILRDVGDRILSIPGRWFGVQYESTINGSEIILEKKLGINFIEGISLPITYIGEGFLMGGYLGAFLFQFLAYLIVILSFILLIGLRGLRPSFLIVLMALQIVKCIYLYPKSLSGVFLVMFYELLRDYIILFFLSQFLRFCQRNVVVK